MGDRVESLKQGGRQEWRKGKLSSGRKGKSQQYQTYVSSSSSSEYEISSSDEEKSDSKASRTLPTSTSTMASLRLHLELKLRKARKGGPGRRRRSSGEGEEGSTRSCENKAMVRPRKKIVREESKTLDLRNGSSDECEEEEERGTGLEDRLLKLKLGNKKKKQQKLNDSSRSKANQMERDE